MSGAEFDQVYLSFFSLKMTIPYHRSYKMSVKSFSFTHGGANALTRFHAFHVFFIHIVGATPLVDSGPSNLLIRWPTLLIRWPTLLFRDPLCWFGFPLCWCGSTQLEKWESESGHRPECWFGSCLESTFWSMPKHRIYKVGHIYNLHGPRINKVCHV